MFKNENNKGKFYPKHLSVTKQHHMVKESTKCGKDDVFHPF